MLELNDWDVTDNNQNFFLESIYTKSFPISERRRFDLMMYLYKNDSNFHVQVAKRGLKAVGFLSFWDLGFFIFAEHFAIDPEVRNEGIGGAIMNAFIAKQVKPIVLEVELPTTILSERRIGFYQRLGYKLWDKYFYQQPPYDQEGLPIPMFLMTLGNIDLQNQYTVVKERIYSSVYNYFI